MLWVITWFVFTADTPSQSKRISLLERDYILESIGERPDTKVLEQKSLLLLLLLPLLLQNNNNNNNNNNGNL